MNKYRNAARKYVVTRQHYYYSGARVVEVETGGWDCVGPGALSAIYLWAGEGGEYADPREAARVAYDVWKAWNQTLNGSTTAVPIQFSWGSTMGMGTEHDPQDTDEDDNPVYLTAIQMFMLADEAAENLPKCDQCGDVLGDEVYDLDGDDSWGFCSWECYSQYTYDAEWEEERERAEEEAERAEAERLYWYDLEHHGDAVKPYWLRGED
jgi:hypothetical protein